MSTISLSYDLAKDDEAQAFRVAVAAEDLFKAVIEFYLFAVQCRDAGASAQPAHEVRALFRKRIPQRTAAWALKANAMKPDMWRRPMRIARLTVEVGLPYLALVNADSIFATARAVDAAFQEDHSPIEWKEMVSVILGKLTENGALAAFQNEVDARASE